MPSDAQVAPASKGMLWTGRIISILVVLFMLFTGALKLIKPAGVVEGFAHFGYPERLILIIGIVEIACAVIYAIPPTSILGAILLTGYLGGATATNVRIGDPQFLMPVVVGVLAWAGLFLRERRLRALLPLRS